MIKFMFEGVAIATKRLEVRPETDWTKGHEETGKWTLVYGDVGQVGRWDTEQQAMDVFNEICKQNGIKWIPNEGFKLYRF